MTSQALTRRLLALFIAGCAMTGAASVAAQSATARNSTAGEVRLDEVVRFVRKPVPACDAIGDPAQLRLYVEGMDTGLRGLGCSDSPQPTASFWFRPTANAHLTPEAREAVWQVILGNALATIPNGRRLDYDIVLVDEAAHTAQHLAPAAHTLAFHIFDVTAWVALGAVLLVGGLLVWLARRSALLRDPANTSMQLKHRSFSLARTQLAWWFSIVFATFVFLWLVTGEAPALSGQALAFLGISGVTTLASAGISAGETLPSAEPGRFFRDLLSDANGITIQRFQMLVMTMALGIVFLIQVVTRLTMPAFDASLLTLLGISAGTYVGLKIPEKQA